MYRIFFVIAKNALRVYYGWVEVMGMIAYMVENIGP